MIRAFFILMLSCVTLSAATTTYYCPRTNDLVAIYVVPTQNTRLIALLSSNAGTNDYSRIFIYDAASSATLDGKTVFKPTNTTGRWLEINVFDVASGFRIAGVAANNRFLKANGTSFVSADLFNTVNDWTEEQDFTLAASNTPMFRSMAAGDPNYRFSVLANGQMNWGPGSAVFDASLDRAAAGSLRVVTNLYVTGLTSGRVVAASTGGLLVSLPAPAVDGYVLSSTIAGVQSWIAPGAPSAFTLTAGNGLTGTTASALLAAATMTVGAGTGISVAADSVAVDQTFTPTWEGLHIWKAGTRISTDTTYESVPEASLQGWFKYNAAGTQRQFGQITFAKENDIDGNDAGSFAIATRANGGSVANKVTVSSAGVVNIDNLTASRYVKASSGKNLSTVETETANFVFAGPVSGGAAVPTFRALVAADVAAIAPTATSAEVIGSSTDYTFSGSGAMEEVDFGAGDPTLSLPSAGTYLIYVTILNNGPVLGSTGFGAQMKNTTTGPAFIGVQVTFTAGSMSFTCATTVAGATTLKLFASCTSTVGTPKIMAAGTLVGYVKLN